MCVHSEGFHSHICLRWVCYDLHENQSRCSIQPSNHLLTVISCSLPNREQNDLAYSALFFLGVKQGVIHHTTQSEHVRLGIRPRQWREQYIGVICCSVWFSLLTAGGCFEYDRPSPDIIRLLFSFKNGCKWCKHRGCLTPLWMTRCRSMHHSSIDTLLGWKVCVWECCGCYHLEQPQQRLAVDTVVT